MAVSKLCLLLVALAAVTFALGNPVPNATTANEDGIEVAGTSQWSDLEKELRDEEDIANDPTAEVAGIAVGGHTDAQIRSLLDVEEMLAEKAANDAVDDTEDDGHGSRRKRAITFTFKVSGSVSKGPIHNVNGNTYHTYRVQGGTFSDAVVQFTKYQRDGAFRAVYKVYRSSNNDHIGYLGLVGPTSPIRVMVRQGLNGNPPSLSFWSPKINDPTNWTVRRFYYY